jgi:hypothetical protein
MAQTVSYRVNAVAIAQISTGPHQTTAVALDSASSADNVLRKREVQKYPVGNMSAIRTGKLGGMDEGAWINDELS